MATKKGRPRIGKNKKVIVNASVRETIEGRVRKFAERNNCTVSEAVDKLLEWGLATKKKVEAAESKEAYCSHCDRRWNTKAKAPVRCGVCHRTAKIED